MKIYRKKERRLYRNAAALSLAIRSVGTISGAIRDSLKSSTIGAEDEHKSGRKGIQLTSAEKNVLLKMNDLHRKKMMDQIHRSEKPIGESKQVNQERKSGVLKSEKTLCMKGSASSRTPKTAVKAAPKGILTGMVTTAGIKGGEKLKEAIQMKMITHKKEAERMCQKGVKMMHDNRAQGTSKVLEVGAGMALFLLAQLYLLAIMILQMFLPVILMILVTILSIIVMFTVITTIVVIAYNFIFTAEGNGGSQIVQVAESEYKSAASNVGGEKYKKWYGMDADWCAIFVSWCANECGFIDEGIIPKSASVAAMRSWFDKEGRLHQNTGYDPKPGDIIFFEGAGMSHVGIVVEYAPDTKIITTVEGNSGSSQSSIYHKGSQVTRNHYSLAEAQITSFGSPQYPDEIEIPKPYGTVYDYMGWQCITSPTSNQYKLREMAGEKYDSDGFAKIGDRYVIACTSTFGSVGDYVDWTLENGEVIKTVIGDIKSSGDADCNKWGHKNGASVVEFVVDQTTWYGSSRSVKGFHPEWDSRVKSGKKTGNYYAAHR